MKLQDEMFALVAEWKSGGLTKKAFLADKAIGLSKFNYWYAKYIDQHQDSKLPTLSSASDFQELLLNDTSAKALAKVFELSTPSGLRITVFE